MTLFLKGPPGVVNQIALICPPAGAHPKWLEKFRALVPESYLASENPRWGGKTSDQAILYECLKGNPRFPEKLKKEESGLFNYRDGQFIKQATRASFSDMERGWIGFVARRKGSMPQIGIAWAPMQCLLT
jgi:hypothetical protein